jgi:hypothetical protein
MRFDGLNIGGYEDRPEWPKMGPSLVIATCLIPAIRTAKWSARSSDSTASNVDLEPRDTFLVTQFRQFLPLKGLFQQPRL